MVLKPILSPAIDSSVVPVLEHSFLNSMNFLSFSKKFEIGWSTDRAKNENPNRVSGLVAKAYLNMGIALKDQGKLEEAIEALHRNILLNPTRLSSPSSNSSALFCMDEEKPLRLSIKLSLQPTSYEAYNNMGVILHMGRESQKDN